MRPYELPLIEEGTAEEQLRQIKSFLYRQAENLNYNLKNSDVTSLWRQTAEALSVASNEEVEQMRRDEFQALRGLIIKSATSIIKNEDSFSAHFAGDYTAESDYGTFTEEGNIFINGNPYTIGQIYKYQAQIVTDVSKYKTDMEGFIKTGVLERGTSEPVFGMEIGYNKNTYTVDDVTHTNNNPAKIRITPLKIGFYQGDDEVAYLEKKAIHFPEAHITGGSIKIGDNFEVTNSGNMRALNATIEGTVRAGAGFIGGFEIRGSSQTEGNYWPCSLSSILTPKGDNYQYAVFMRGFYNEGGNNYGAIDNTHVVFGLKKMLKAKTDWDEDAEYLFFVNGNGNVRGNIIEANEFTMNQIKFTDTHIMLGFPNTRDPAGNITKASYGNPIELYTSDEIKIGTFRDKAKKIYLLASETIRIGQHTDQSAQRGSPNFPSTANVDIQASGRFRVGAKDYEVANAYFFATSTQFSGVVAPMANNGCDLGHTSYKWKNVYATTVNATTVNADYISGYVTIGEYVSDKFIGVTVGSDGHLTLCGLVGDKKYKKYSLYDIVQYMLTTNTTANTAVSTADKAKLTADTAKSTADTAKSTADTAKSTADTAKSTADTAASTVESYVVWAGQITDFVNNQAATKSDLKNLNASIQTSLNSLSSRISKLGG